MPARYEIRLLEVLPGRPGSRVTARLFHVSLDDAPHFDALSYMWGAPRPTYDIKVMYRQERLTRYPIGRNLRKALDDLRFPDRPRILWADAICINQADHSDRERQVGLMRRIYSSAQRVCAWIDHKVVFTLDVFDDLQRLGEGIEIEDIHDAEYWHPVADIFRNPYWRRLWIQQELVLARNIDIYCRRHRFDGQKLLLFQQNVEDVGFSRLPIQDPKYRLSAYMKSTDDKHGQRVAAEEKENARLNLEARERIQQLCLDEEHVPKNIWEDLFSLYRWTNRSLNSRAFYGGILRAKNAISWAQQRSQDSSGPDLPPGQQRGPLVDLFAQSLNLMVTEPRDRVYGVLGLVTDTDPDEVMVDYTMPLMGVFSQIFKLHIQRYKSLSFLCIDHTPRNEFLPNHQFPSWMPVRQRTLSATVNASNASGGFKAENARINTETYILSVEGVMVDTISFVGDREAFSIQPVTYWLDKLEHYCQRLWPTSQEGPLYEREDVTELLFPLLVPKRYWSLYKVEKPTPGQRLDTVRSLLRASSRADRRGFSLADAVFGGYTPLDLLTPEQRLRCMLIHFAIIDATFLGTKGGRLGSIQVSVATQAGDQVWVILGCEMPIILRPVEGMDGRYIVVGPVIICRA